MGYYVRILSPSEKVPSLARVRADLAMAKLAGVVTPEAGGDDDWTQISLSHAGKSDIAAIERNSASSGDLVAGEIEEFLELIADEKPASAAAWLTEYLPTVKTIYALQVLNGTYAEHGWEIFETVKNSIFAQVGGIIQADGEGFTDEAGYHILWQFSSSVKGTWWMGVLQDDRWVHFEMDLGDQRHRSAFLRGEVPDGVKLA